MIKNLQNNKKLSGGVGPVFFYLSRDDSFVPFSDQLLISLRMTTTAIIAMMMTIMINRISVTDNPAGPADFSTTDPEMVRTSSFAGM